MNSTVATVATLALAATAATAQTFDMTHYVIFTSSKVDFGVTDKTTSADTQIQSAITAAAAASEPCKNGALEVVTHWISNKNMKEATYVISVTQDCCDNGWEPIKVELAKSFAAEKNNKITLKNDDMGSIHRIHDCMIPQSSPAEYGCAGSADVTASCKSILCNVGTTCSKDEQCGTKKCATIKKDSEKIQECSGVGAISSILAVGAAFAVAAVSFF